MNKYIFVDVVLNSLTRVRASTADDAWIKYIERVYANRLKTEPFKELREDLEHDIFVVSDDTEVTEIG